MLVGRVVRGQGQEAPWNGTKDPGARAARLCPRRVAVAMLEGSHPPVLR